MYLRGFSTVGGCQRPAEQWDGKRNTYTHILYTNSITYNCDSTYRIAFDNLSRLRKKLNCGTVELWDRAVHCQRLSQRNRCCLPTSLLLQSRGMLAMLLLGGDLAMLLLLFLGWRLWLPTHQERVYRPNCLTRVL